MPTNIETLQQARALYYMRRAPEAIALLEELLTAEPDNAEYLIHQALYLRAVGQFEESLQMLQKVPHDMPGYHMLMGWHLLRQGKFLDGMRTREPESGLHRIDRRYPFPPEKKLQPGMPIAGKKILLALEGGNGDEVAYVRFVQTLTKLGAQVLVGSSPEMISIIERATDADEVCPIEAVSHDQYDYYVPALSVISLFGVEHPSNNITFPYISADPARRAHWKSIIEKVTAGRLKIGIQWQGNMEFEHIEFKSISAEVFAPFADLGTLYSLQRPETVGENKLPPHVPIVDTQPSLPNWEDTLAIINEMDVIIAGDTTITHLAGALGKKTCILLPHAPHPYWADLQETSSWYPSVHVFRQPHYNDWAGAAQHTYEYIKEYLYERC